MTQNFDFDTPIDRTGTYCTQWDYVQDRFGKAGLLPFTISDMDFAAPEPVMNVLKQRLEHPVLGYSRWNHEDFKSAIRYWYQTRFDCEIDTQQVVYGPSVIYIVSKLIEQWSQPGQGVVFHTPAYDAFDKMIEGQDRTCVRSPLIKQCFKRHVPYVGGGCSQDWAVVTSASKSFNIPALNGAYALIADSPTRERYLHKLKEVDGLSSPSIMGVLGTMAAYRHGEPWLKALNEYVLANHQYVKEALESAFPEVSYLVPDATYLAWIDLSVLNLDMTLLNQALIERFNVAIMSGDVYGDSGKGYLRLNLGCPRSKVEQGVSALIQAIKLQC
ncbi:aminotransferase class I/II-fold pyridoxal phosphate-dependent enzyme [Vibrio harveyi]|uniref:MalY/PatB family protein n=1 Tax=Vibrio harveyi TaxID=669 RepID=UPI002F410E1D